MKHVADLLTSVETIPGWIEQDEINKLSETIISEPHELHTLLDYLVQTLNEFGETTDLAITKATDEIKHVTEYIHSDIEAKDFLISNLGNLNDTYKLQKTCALVDESEQFVITFGAAMKDCSNKYQETVVPQLPTIVRQLNKFTLKLNNAILGANDIDVIKNDVENFITVIQSESENIEWRANKAIEIFKNCIKNNGNECEQHFKEIYTQIQAVLN